MERNSVSSLDNGKKVLWKRAGFGVGGTSIKSLSSVTRRLLQVDHGVHVQRETEPDTEDSAWKVLTLRGVRAVDSKGDAIFLGLRFVMVGSFQQGFKVVGRNENFGFEKGKVFQNCEEMDKEHLGNTVIRLSISIAAIGTFHVSWHERPQSCFTEETSQGIIQSSRHNRTSYHRLLV